MLHSFVWKWSCTFYGKPFFIDQAAFSFSNANLFNFLQLSYPWLLSNDGWSSVGPCMTGTTRGPGRFNWRVKSLSHTIFFMGHNLQALYTVLLALNDGVKATLLVGYSVSCYSLLFIYFCTSDRCFPSFYLIIKKTHRPETNFSKESV